MQLRRRDFVNAALATIGTSVLPGIAVAEGYPARSVRLVVGFPAGGAGRHCRSPYRPMAFRETRSGVHHRKSAGAERECGDEIGGQVGP